MAASNALLVLAIIAALWGVASSIVMIGYLSNRGVKINWPFIRLFMPKYAGQYREMTAKESGRPGWWYRSFVVSMGGALGAAIIGLIIRAI